MFAVVLHSWFVFSPVVPPPAESEIVEKPPKFVLPAEYRHLPGEKECEARYNAAQSAMRCIKDQGIQLGWYDMQAGWCGGGWQAQMLKEEFEKQERMAAVAWAAWFVCWPASSDDTRAEWADSLRFMIGDSDYNLGRLP